MHRRVCSVRNDPTRGPEVSREMSHEPNPPSVSPLDDSQRRLQAVLNNATVAIFLMDDRQHCIYMNAAAEQLTGYRFEEVLSLDRPLHDIVHHTHPDGRPFPISECPIDRAFPEHNQVQGEAVFVHKDGSFYPVAFTASPIRDEASQTIGTIIEVRNIQQEKLAQERQQFLINELHHRVKNTLATLQSVAWHTFRNVDANAVALFEGRIAALSRAHNILAGSSWERASLSDVVRAAVEPFGPDRFAIDGRECEIHPKAALTLSMALHELGTNAAKYGSLRLATGRVAIEWTHRRSGGQLALQLVWREHGGPPVAPPTRKGFGSRLIERQLAGEFGGKVLLQFPPDGVVCVMDLVLPGLPQPLDS
jgi:PAS domain S-box-containing protein